jgi:hypothetical protein
MEDRHLVVMAAAGAATLASCASATSNRTRHPDNFAFMFIKPHANKKAVVSLVKAKLAEASVRVASEGVISAAQIDDGGLIDAHYGTLAQRAMSVPVLELGVWSASKAADFEEKFGVAHTGLPCAVAAKVARCCWCLTLRVEHVHVHSRGRGRATREPEAGHGAAARA